MRPPNGNWASPEVPANGPLDGPSFIRILTSLQPQSQQCPAAPDPLPADTRFLLESIRIGRYDSG